jgi:putative PIN family toxin of toxin-antitoxin system
MRLVLDTNVWIDWLVFDDPSVTPLKAAHGDGRIRIMINAACLRELSRVLGYPELDLTEMQKASVLAEAERRCSDMNEPAQYMPSAALPRCTDPDDQKFLELAGTMQADWLLTRDKALLRLGKKKRLAARFRIGTPQQWAAASGHASSAAAARCAVSLAIHSDFASGGPAVGMARIP